MNGGNRPRVLWASRFGFVLAAAGSAIGLGNIWKFPYITGQHGGGAFVLVYLACIVLVGVPILMAELLIGRQGRRDAVGCFAALERPRSPWMLVGWGGVAASFILLSFYAVVAGWSFDYVVMAARGALHGRSPVEIEGLFGALVSSPTRVIFWQGLFVAATVAVVLGGVRGGIERCSRILMPALFILLLVLFGRGLLSSGGPAALRFMFQADFSLLTPQALLDALGHAFFTLSLGAGTMITYASYLDPEADLGGLALRIALLDTLMALLAALTIFSVAFAAGIEPGAGPGLVFQTLPILLLELPFGSVLALLFFLLLAFAALSSSISMLEVTVAYLVDEKAWPRWRATGMVGVAAFLVGLPSALSFNLWQDYKFFFGRTFFDACDLLVSSYLLPLGGLMVAIYVGWIWPRRHPIAEIVSGHRQQLVVRGWIMLLRYVAPAAVIIVLLNQAGVFH
jgi:neurotransmitter:Na+ symporter, NSS family